MQKFYFHVSPADFIAGQIKAKGSFGTLLLGDPKYVEEDPDGEFLRERERETNHPEKPSRLRSSFVFETLEDAKRFRDRRGRREHIYKVSFAANPASIHRVCLSAWSQNHFNLPFQAHEFWSSPPLYASDTEVFAEEDLIIFSEV